VRREEEESKEQRAKSKEQRAKRRELKDQESKLKTDGRSQNREAGTVNLALFAA
jgi:hypothetical protein